MTDEDRIRELIRSEIEIVIKTHGWPDEVVMEALLQVAKNHLWQQGLMVRLRYWVNVVGFMGVIAGAIAMIVSILGFDVVRKP
jgi:hypothetical protein